MANPENPKFSSFVNERGQKIVDRRNPSDFSVSQLEEFLERAILSTLNGNPMRIHIVFPGSVNIVTEHELSKTRTLQEADKFKKLQALRMVCSQEIFFLRQSSQNLKKNP